MRACDKFVYVDILQKDQHNADIHEDHSSTSQTSKNGAKSEPDIRSDKTLFKMLKDAYEAYVGDDGWAALGALGSQLIKVSPSFDSRNYGYAKLSGLIKATGWFEVKDWGTSGAKHLKIKRLWSA